MNEPPAPEGRRVRIGRWAGPLVALLLLLLPAPAGMPPAAWRTAAVALLMAVWWISEAIPLAATSLLPLALFPLLGIADIGAAATPYANPVIFLFLGGFLIAAALEACGLHRRIALTIIRLVGPSPTRVIGGFMLATAFVSMWVSNTATVAMFLPLALSVAALADGAGERNFGVALMLGLAAAANIGGLGTLIGTPPNALLAAFMAETYQVRIGFGAWMLVGVPLVIVALPAAWWLLTRVCFPVRMSELPGGRELIRSEVAALGRPTAAERVVGAITALTAIAWLLGPALEPVIPGLSDAGIAVSAALLLFLVPSSREPGRRLLDWERGAQVPWGVLLLFGGGLSLAEAIQDSGLALWLGGALDGLRVLPLPLIVLLVTALLVFLTELASNTAITAAFLPVVGALAVGLGADPLFLAAPAALGASCGFMLPVGTPPNAMVYGTGRVRMGEMVRVGFRLDLFMIVLVSAAAFAVVRLIAP